MFITRSSRSTIARSGVIYPMYSHTSASKRRRRVGRCSPPATGCAISRTATSRTTTRPLKSSTRPGGVTSCRKTVASIFGPSPSACSAICKPQFTGATCLPTRAGATQIRGPICCPMPSGGYTRQAAIRPNKLATADSDKRKRPIRSAASRSPYSKKRYGNDSPENGPLLTLLERKPVQPAPGHEAISYQATGLMLWAFLRSGSPRDGRKGVCRNPTPSRPSMS
jgi:hypothetical protein